MKIAIIGAWHVHTSEYTQASLDNPSAEVVGVWDKNADRAKACAEKHSIPVIATYEEILADKDIDSVVICTETSDHPEIIKKAAEAGKNIFTEKVLAFTEKEAADMAEVIDAKAGKFTICYPHLTFPHVRAIKACVESGKLGRITYARVRNVHGGSVLNWLPETFYDKATCGGGAMMDLGAHPMYTLAVLLGAPVSVTSTFTKITDRAVEDNAVSVIEFENGAIGVSETGFVSVGNPYTLEVSGTEGAIVARGENVMYMGADNEWQTVELPEKMERPIHHWIDAVVNDKVAPFTTKDAIMLSRLMEGAYIAHETGKKYNF